MFSGRGLRNTLSFACCQAGRWYENKFQRSSWSARRFKISRVGWPGSPTPFASQPPVSSYLCKLPHSTRPKTKKELFWFRTHLSTGTICGKAKYFVHCFKFFCKQNYILQPSSCLSDQEGDDIYDFAGKYRTQIRQHQAKMLMTPQG